MEEGKATPHGVLLLLVVGLVATGSSILEDGTIFKEIIEKIFNHGVPLLLPIFLIFLIRAISTERVIWLANLLSSSSPDSIHRASGSPVGVGLLLVVILLLLYFRFAPYNQCRVDCDDKR